MSAPIEREEAIFQAAIQLESPAARSEYVSDACGNDAGLRAQVLALVSAHEKAGAFLDQPISGVRLSSAVTVKLPASANHGRAEPTEKPGDQIGRYKLLQLIGEGGCGVVYMAEQEEPVRRRVALKIIKAGMDTRQVIARFEAERQALAMMDHPNIARVLDAGATETGRPYFVMELVRGIKITEYCDQSQLPTEQRLELFIQVCNAIQHAHQKGIIHRDIKPSNILVTLHDGAPVPLIIDFGIAKATEQRLTNKTLFTAFEQFIGTPAYMSPEQAEMSRLDIDTRSDIYALGVLLYELLTGRTPFDGKELVESGLDQLRRTIREKEPPRPSTRLSTMVEGELTAVAKHRRAEPVRLINLVRGDLDWIVMKCLEKDRTRRYETANGLALDIQRHLHNEPIFARPPSRIYRLQKLIRRNKAAFAAGTAVAAALIIGLVLSTFLYMREREAYRRAVFAERNESRLRREAEKAQDSATEERHKAEDNARRSRLNSYAADVYSAFMALQSGNLGRAYDLLEYQAPKPGEEDLRGFEWRYLRQQVHGDELFSLPHPALVSCAIFAPNRRELATASYDGLLRIWDLPTKRVLRTIDGFDQQFEWRYIACSPDGRWLAGIRHKKLTVWDRSNYSIRFEKESAARVIAFASDSSQLVGWGDSGLVLVDTSDWRATNLRTQLKPESFPCLAIDRSGKLAALAHERDNRIEIWNLETHEPARLLTIPSLDGMAYVSLAWSPDGLLAAATWGGRLLLLDARTGEELVSKTAHTGSVFGLAFAPDAKLLVTAGHDQLLQLWSMPSLEKLATLRGHRDEIWALDFSQDGRLLCTAGKDGTVKIWSPEPKPAPAYPSPWYAGAFTEDGRFVTLSEPNAELTLDFWDLANPGVRTAKMLPIPELTNVLRTAISPDAKLLGIGRADGALELWSIESGKLLRAERAPAKALSQMTFAGDGSLLAIGNRTGEVAVWNLENGRMTRLRNPVNGSITRMSFTPGNRFLTALVDGRPPGLLWDMDSGSAAPLPLPPMERFAVSPDGATLAVAANDYSVGLFDLPSLRPRATLRGHRWVIYALQFSPDGRLLATGGGDAIALLWDVSTGRQVTRPLRGHLQGVTELAFTPDAKLLATGSTDQTVRFWHVATGRELFNATESSGPEFSPDGNTLVLQSASGPRLFHVPSLDEMEAAKRLDR